MAEKPPKPPAGDWADFMGTNRKWQRAFIALIAALVFIAAIGAFFYSHNHKSSKSSKTVTTVTAPVAKISAQTKTYDSPNFYLSFNYPADWIVTDKGGGIMTVVSPPIGLTDSSGQKVTGQITLTFRSAGQPLPEYDKGNATATLDSQKIAYTSPSQNQRANTYLSFLTYASSTSNGIDGIYITGDNGYKQGQAIPKVDVQKIDPIISLTFAKCSDAQCSGKTTPLNLAVSAWNDPKLSQPLITMLESLSIT